MKFFGSMVIFDTSMLIYFPGVNEKFSDGIIARLIFHQNFYGRSY